VAALLLALALTACQSPNQIAKQIGAPSANALELRALQARRFDTSNSIVLLGAATQTLQDLGYTITESSSEVGVLVGTKQRDAEETGQVVGQIMLTVFLAALGSAHTPTWDKDQSIHVTLVVTPVENAEQAEVRVSFDRLLRNNHGIEWRAELIKEQGIYQEFFQKLSQGVALEAEQV